MSSVRAYILIKIKVNYFTVYFYINKMKKRREAISLSRAPFAKFEKYEITVNAVLASLIRHIYVSDLIETV